VKETWGNREEVVNQPEIATREEVLALLTAKAREGSISAATALERALRIGADGNDEEADDDAWAELDRYRP
jgi:hypothetical protein